MPKLLSPQTSLSLQWCVSFSLLAACSACSHVASPDAGRPVSERSVASLRLIGEQRIAHRQDFNGTPLGGLSGIDYDPVAQHWVLVSDDRSDGAPARFYTAELSYTADRFEAVRWTAVQALKQADGSDYPGAVQYRQQRQGELADIESVRIDPLDASLWYASEGLRSVGMQPFVRQADRSTGALRADVPLPELFKTRAQSPVGPRDNASFEGLSFAPDGRSLWLAMEAPLYQDGEPPSSTAGALSRLTQLARDGRMLAQFAYEIDPLPAPPAAGKNADNGVSDLLALNDHQFLVVERAAVQGADGHYVNYIRLYEIDIRGATDVRGLSTLSGATIAPVTKRLVLDLNTLNLPRLDNIEGISWGPVLPNGHASLVLVSDDNFSSRQVTQFLAFDVLPAHR
jgi:hypothetical protein